MWPPPSQTSQAAFSGIAEVDGRCFGEPHHLGALALPNYRYVIRSDVGGLALGCLLRSDVAVSTDAAFPTWGLC